MIALDTNILIYAHRTDSPFHRAAVSRLVTLTEGDAPWAIPWPCVHEFYSIATNPMVYRPSATVDEAIGFIDALRVSPGIQFLSETDRHWDEIRQLIMGARVIRGAVHDARIAAICIQHGVSELWSADRDFSRFPQIRVVNPLVGA